MRKLDSSHCSPGTGQEWWIHKEMHTFLSEHQETLVTWWLAPIICYRLGIKVNSQPCEDFVSKGTCPEHPCSPDCLETLRFANLAWPAAVTTCMCLWRKNRREHLGIFAISFSVFWCLGLDLSNLLPSDNYCPEVRSTKINKPLQGVTVLFIPYHECLALLPKIINSTSEYVAEL